MKAIKKVQVIVLFLCLFLSGCSKKIKKGDSIKSLQMSVCEQEARLVDVPIPVNAKPITNFDQRYKSGKTCQLSYRLDSSEINLEKFYENGMERSGWKKIAKCSCQELLLIFEKPSKICVISVRSEKPGKETLVIFFVPKDLSEN